MEYTIPSQYGTLSAEGLAQLFSMAEAGEILNTPAGAFKRSTSVHLPSPITVTGAVNFLLCQALQPPDRETPSPISLPGLAVPLPFRESQVPLPEQTSVVQSCPAHHLLRPSELEVEQRT